MDRHLILPGHPFNEGLIEAYIHPGGRVGALVELRCETVFVVRTNEFRTLAREIAMQVVAMDPQSVGSDDSASPDPNALLDQEYIRDSSITIRDLIRRTIGMLGENIEIGRFVRFEVGTSGN